MPCLTPGRGGSDAPGHGLSSVESYDPDKHEWTLQAEMGEARCFPGVALAS